MAEMKTVTTLWFTRGRGLEAILDQFTETDEVRLVGIKFKSSLTADHQLLYNIGCARLIAPRGLKLDAQFWTESEVRDFWKNYELYQDLAARRGDGGVFDRGYIEEVYLLDKTTNTVAKFALVPTKDRIYTSEYDRMGIKALNPKYQSSLELTNPLYTLNDKDKLKKWKMIPNDDWTRPSLEKLLPGICASVRMRTCIRERSAIMTDKEISCSFEGTIPR